jgi:hypothetical protein
MNGTSVERAPSLWERRGSVLGIVAVACLAISFVFAANTPGSTDGDAKIASWYTSTSHQYTQILGFLGFTVGVLCLIGFLAVLRERTAEVEGAPGSLGQLAFGAGIASAVLFSLAIGLFSVPAFLAMDGSPADIVPSTYRMIYTAAVVSWVAATMIAALTVFATSALAFRTGFLPRWFGWLGALVGALQLLGFFFIPGFAFWAWILIAAVLLLRSAPAPSPNTVPSSSAGRIPDAEARLAHRS